MGTTQLRAALLMQDVISKQANNNLEQSASCQVS